MCRYPILLYGGYCLDGIGRLFGIRGDLRYKYA